MRSQTDWATSHYASDALDEGRIIEQEVARISSPDQVKDLFQKAAIWNASNSARASTGTSTIEFCASKIKPSSSTKIKSGGRKFMAEITRTRSKSKAEHLGEVERVYRLLKSWLIEAQLAPGEILSEVDLASRAEPAAPLFANPSAVWHRMAG